MKKILIALMLCVVMVSMVASPVMAGKPTYNKIQDGVIKDSEGNLIELGYDKYGYNYQAHIFNGFADNYSRPAVPVTEGDRLVMKWSDSWMANVDTNGDLTLDRGLVDGVASGTSMGWCTNHYEGSYDSDGDGSLDAHYTEFYKIVWTGPGSPLWGQYTVIEYVLNDPLGGLNGLQSKIGAPGFGLNNQWTVLD